MLNAVLRSVSIVRRRSVATDGHDEMSKRSMDTLSNIAPMLAAATTSYPRAEATRVSIGRATSHSSFLLKTTWCSMVLAFGCSWAPGNFMLRNGSTM